MRKVTYSSLLLFVLSFFGCDDDYIPLNTTKQQNFEGSFKLLNSSNFPKLVEDLGTTTLEVSNGYFKSTTYTENRGYGHSAGRLKITENKIQFIDTVFKGWPMHIVPPSYLHGTYDYRFDGSELEIGTKHGPDWSEFHTLRLK